MSYKLIEIEGIGPKYAETLEATGLKSTDDLLAACATPKGRKELAEQTGISDKLILRWANMADLMRIKGIGEEYSDLLEAAGVDTVPELAQRNPANLAKAMAEANEQKKLTRQVPSESMVEGWVAQAKEMDRKLSY